MSYGLVLLAFVVRERVTITLSDEQVAAAIHVAPIASAVHVVVGPDKRREVDHRVLVADAVADAVRELTLTQRLRERLRALERAGQGDGVDPGQPVTGGAQPGSAVPRRPIAPTEPPAGSYADRPVVTLEF